ncbi:hypothetical protein Fmac_014262 [Flemingia macrophylla]|uniref:peroxidase n=1 Tax=Flemingia macrophylla TaxID=520843 RepID=A0ABD1MB89_9FABA
MASRLQYFLAFAMATLVTIPSHAQLTPHFYDKVCPQAMPIIKSVVQRAIFRERRIGASLLRMHFHDCFVNGCDASVLLDDTPNFIGEKSALPNMGSLRGFEVIDEIKAAVDKACKRPLVSCADILAIAARDSISISHGLDLEDLVALSGAHTIGFAQCSAFRNRIYNDTNIDHNFASSLQTTCPSNGGGNSNLVALDRASPSRFDTSYYTSLLSNKGLLHSDQELFKGDGSESDTLVKLYSKDPSAFARDFKASMIKMGNMKPLTGNVGEIRSNCRRVN